MSGSRHAAIIAPVRTAIGKFGGTLRDVPAYKLGAVVLDASLRRAGLSGEEIDDVIMGCVLQAGQGMNPARQAAVGAGVPVRVSAMTINRVCGSGMQAVVSAVQSVRAGDCQIVAAGGFEVMSGAPYILPRARWGLRMGHHELVDSMIYDGLHDAFSRQHMGLTAEALAERYSISREEQDEFALWSQQKAAQAIAEGRFTDEIVPVLLDQHEGKPESFSVDEHPRPDVTLARLAQLRPAFRPDGTVTAGNSSGINDGAACMLVASADILSARSLSPVAWVAGYSVVGLEPELMGLGPVLAIKQAVDRAGLRLNDIGLFEINEAFAATVIAVLREIDIPREKLNVNGGAIALGHPIGASGARIVVTLIHEMRRRKVRYGLASVCIGGGMGAAIVLENPDAEG